MNEENRIVKLAKDIEYFAKHASKEIEKKSLLGTFYSAVTVILTSILAALAIRAIIGVTLSLPTKLQWFGVILATIVLVSVGILFIKWLIKENRV